MESVPGRARLKDVAAAAGVSVATASRVLSGQDYASSHAAEAVLAASKKLKYRPNPIARALRAQTTGLAGMVVPGVGNPFFAELIEATERALQRSGLELILADSRGSAVDEAMRLETIVDRKIDGLIVIPSDHHLSAPALTTAQSHGPVVQIDRSVDGFRGDYVGVDNGLGIRLILEHLIEQDCRRVVFVSGESGSSTGRSRLEAFRTSVERFPTLRAAAPLLGSFSVEFGREAARRVLRAKRLPDAIVCGSDIIALGVVRGLHEAGIAIPEDVRITGFDGILFAELSDPPLTTVKQPTTTIAEEAVRLLIRRMSGENEPPQRSEMAPTIQIRRSSLHDGGSHRAQA